MAYGYGFIPIGGIDGRPYNGGTQRFVVLGADTSDFGVGDFVTLAGTGSTAGVTAVTGASATDPILGAVVSIDPIESSSALWIDGSVELADRHVNVAVATDGMLFQCASASAIAVTSIGLLGDSVVVAPAAPFYKSKSTISATVTTSPAQLQIVGVVQNGKAATASDADLIVRVAEPQMGDAKLSIGA